MSVARKIETGVEANEARWPGFNRPMRNAELLVGLTGALRSQALTSEVYQIEDEALIAQLRDAQDDITSAIQLIEKRTGRKA